MNERTNVRPKEYKRNDTKRKEKYNNNNTMCTILR